MLYLAEDERPLTGVLGVGANIACVVGRPAERESRQHQTDRPSGRRAERPEASTRLSEPLGTTNTSPVERKVYDADVRALQAVSRVLEYSTRPRRRFSARASDTKLSQSGNAFEKEGRQAEQAIAPLEVVHGCGTWASLVRWDGRLGAQPAVTSRRGDADRGKGGGRVRCRAYRREAGGDLCWITCVSSRCSGRMVWSTSGALLGNSAVSNVCRSPRGENSTSMPVRGRGTRAVCAGDRGAGGKTRQVPDRQVYNGRWGVSR